MKWQFLSNLSAKIQFFRIFFLLKIVNFDTEIKIDHFSSFSRICSFWTKKCTFDTLWWVLPRWNPHLNVIKRFKRCCSPTVIEDVWNVRNSHPLLPFGKWWEMLRESSSVIFSCWCYVALNERTLEHHLRDEGGQPDPKRCDAAPSPRNVSMYRRQQTFYMRPHPEDFSQCSPRNSETPTTQVSGFTHF